MDHYTQSIPYNSFEFGKANRRHKIYYITIEELTSKLAKLQNLGLIDNEYKINFDKIKNINKNV